MLDPVTLRDLVSHRVTFEYENGASIVGYLAETRPAQGAVQGVVVAAALLYSPERTLVGRYDELTLVPDTVTRLTADGERLVLEYDSGARLEGVRSSPQPFLPWCVMLEGVTLSERSGRMIGRRALLPVIPESVIQYSITEGPLGIGHTPNPAPHARE